MKIVSYAKMFFRYAFGAIGGVVVLLTILSIGAMVVGFPALGLTIMAGDINIPLLFVWWPFALALTFVLFIFEKSMRVPEDFDSLSLLRRRMFLYAPGPITSIWVAWYLSPIELNIISLTLRNWGHGWLAGVVYAWRADAHLYTALLIVVLVITGVLLVKLINKLHLHRSRSPFTLSFW